MRKRRIYFGLLLLAVVLVAVFWEREPKCWGKGLSQWVDELTPYGHGSFPPQGPTQAGNAVLEIGTNAVPYLLKWMAYDPPFWKTTYYEIRRELLKKSSNWQDADRRTVRAEKALEAFYNLGPKAGHAAIPSLCGLVKDGGDRSSMWRAVSALTYLGEDGFEALWATTRNSRRGLLAAFHVVEQIGDGVVGGREKALPAVPGLIRFLKDRDEKVAEQAAKALGQLRLAPNLVVPALANCLQDSRWQVRAQAANSLSSFGADAKTAVPALVSALNDTNARVRWKVTNALNEVNWSVSHKASSE